MEQAAGFSKRAGESEKTINMDGQDIQDRSNILYILPILSIHVDFFRRHSHPLGQRPRPFCDLATLVRRRPRLLRVGLREPAFDRVPVNV